MKLDDLSIGVMWIDLKGKMFDFAIESRFSEMER